MNRAHVVGCPALRGGTPCTCQVQPARFEFVEYVADLTKLMVMGFRVPGEYLAGGKV